MLSERTCWLLYSYIIIWSYPHLVLVICDVCVYILQYMRLCIVCCMLKGMFYLCTHLRSSIIHCCSKIVQNFSGNDNLQTSGCSLIQSLVTCPEIPSTKTKETTTCSVSPIWKEIFLDFPCPSDGGLHGLHHRPGWHLQKSAKRLREHGNTMWFLWLFFFSFFKFRYAVKSKLSTTLSRAKCPNCIRLLVRDSLVLKGWWFTGDHCDPSWFPSACVGCCIYTTRGQRRGSQTPAWFEPRYGGSQLNVGLREQGFSKSSTKGTFNYESHLWIVFEHVFQSNVKITFSIKGWGKGLQL